MWTGTASELLAALSETLPTRKIDGERAKQVKDDPSTPEDETANTMDPQAQAEVNEDRIRIRRALAKLPAKPATVLVLRSSGLSYSEIAESIGVGTGQIGTLLRRAEAALRKEVNRGTSE